MMTARICFFTLLIIGNCLPIAMAGADAPRILPMDEHGVESSHRVIWSTQPGALYELQQSVDLENWVPVAGFPREAEGESEQHAFKAESDRLFFRVRKIGVDEDLREMVEVEGGTLMTPSDDELNVETFHVGRYEVTWGEWKAVREWAVVNGYDIAGAGEGCADDHPVHTVHRNEVMKWCNAKSEMEGLTPAYTMSGATYRMGGSTWDIPDWNVAANGYRLPSEAEWEFAARGGINSHGYTYSGGDEIDDVAWYRDNSAGALCDLWNDQGTWAVGKKMGNELDLHDMTGNVGELCRAEDGSDVTRGGGWKTLEVYASISSFEPWRYGGSLGSDIGFRLVRSAGRDGDSPMLHLSGDLSFGRIRIAHTSTRTLVVSNFGKHPLSVTGITVPKGFAVDWSGGLIAGHTSQQVEVSFRPFAARSYSGEIVVQSDTISGNNTRSVTGQGINNQVHIQGGQLPAVSNLGDLSVTDFSIGQYEVTWGEWKEVRDWAVLNGYDLEGRGDGCTDAHPVHSISWYDAVKWSNAKSEWEGLTPAYGVDGRVYRNGEAVPEWDNEATGYRLPSEMEWEFAARGGTESKGYTYSGSNNVHAVTVYEANSNGAECDLIEGRGTWSVGRKQANELGLFDMSGNVWEWCWEPREEAEEHREGLRGSSWNNSALLATVRMRAVSDAAWINTTIGFRLARNTTE